MPKQHTNVLALRQYQRWRRGANEREPIPSKVGEVLDWAIAVCEAADNLVNVKGRHHAELAYKRLEEAVNGKEGGAS